MTDLSLGIDVSKDTLDVCLLSSDAKQTRQYGNDSKGHRALHGWIKKRCGSCRPHACLEATGQYGEAIAEFLYRRQYAVSVVNPLKIKRYAQSLFVRNKTDRADAQIIASFCQERSPDLWAPPAPHLHCLKAMTRRLEDLQDTLIQEKNRLHATRGESSVADDIMAHIQYLEEAITSLKKQIQDHINRHPDLRKKSKLLCTIPGIGQLTAARILSEIPNLAQFESARQLAAYSGLTPRNHLSGSSIHPRARLSKQGNVHLRRMLYMPAVVAKRYNPIVAAFYQRLVERGLAGLAAIAACMRKLLHIIYGVLKHEAPFDPNYLVNQSIAA